jgi:hypothetical protein
MAILDELAKSNGISVDVATSKALVRHVKKGEQLALLDHLAHFFPLFWLLKKKKKNNQKKHGYRISMF